MEPKHKELEALIAFLRANGVTHYEGDVVLTLGPLPIAPAVPAEKALVAEPPPKSFNERLRRAANEKPRKRNE